MLVSQGLDNNRTVIRLGWEMNGNWYAWSATIGREASFISAWRHVVTAIRAGGATSVQFDWCVNKGNQSNTNGWAAYPGDDYVDILGVDFYDYWDPSFTDAQFNGNAAKVPSLNDVAAYCTAHGKQIALDEWGLAHDAYGGNDNPFFIQKVWNWISAHAGLLAYETTYDDKGAPDTLHHKLSSPEGDTWNPQAGALYKRLWGADSALPEFSTQPVSQSISLGASANFTIAVQAPGASSLRWQVSMDGEGWVGLSDDHIYAGTASSTLSITGATSAQSGYRYRCVASDSTSSRVSDAATLTVEKRAGGSAARLVNIAARAFCGTDNALTIGGFVIAGGAPKRVLIRAVGPSLTAAGVGAAEVLADPTVEVHAGAPVLATNDNWTDNANSAEIAAIAARIGASELLSGDRKSSALLLELPAGVYSFLVRGAGGTSGIVLLEVYDADESAGGSPFVNIATRAWAGTGDRVAIGGFVIGGAVPKQVLLRAVGQTLVNHGLAASEVLADSTIELHHGTQEIGVDNDFSETAHATAIRTTAARIGAAPLAATDRKSAALLMTLQPGVYSFIARGRNDATGIALVEVYDAD